MKIDELIQTDKSFLSRDSRSNSLRSRRGENRGAPTNFSISMATFKPENILPCNCYQHFSEEVVRIKNIPYSMVYKKLFKNDFSIIKTSLERLSHKSTRITSIDD